MSEIPTIEEYKQVIWDIYKYQLRGTAPEEELKAYFDGDEANEEIAERYRSDMRKYKEGKLSKTAWRDAEASVAYCLSLMF